MGTTQVRALSLTSTLTTKKPPGCEYDLHCSQQCGRAASHQPAGAQGENVKIGKATPCQSHAARTTLPFDNSSVRVPCR